MNRRSIKAKFIILVVMTVAIAALTLPVCAFGFCEGCVQQCHDEGTQYYLNCLSTTSKPERQCYDEWQQYERNCFAVFCPGCPINH